MSEDRCELLCLDLPRAEALRREAPPLDSLEVAAARSRALADPTRLAIAVALARGGELCVCDVAWVVERDVKLVSHHLRVLRSAALVRSRREGKMAMYELTPGGSALLEAVMGAAVAA